MSRLTERLVGVSLLADGSLLAADVIGVTTRVVICVVDVLTVMAGVVCGAITGTVLKMDGTVLMKDGTVLKMDGTVLMKDGTVLTVDGT
ncbi:MAG: hypothetical protein ABW185_20055, partial [Sedimenticola sp.]